MISRHRFSSLSCISYTKSFLSVFTDIKLMSKYNKTLFVNTVRRVLLFANLTGFAMFDACILCKTTSTPSFVQSVERDVKENRAKKNKNSLASSRGHFIFSRFIYGLAGRTKRKSNYS